MIKGIEFLQNSNFLNPIVLQPDNINHRLFDLTECIVWNI